MRTFLLRCKVSKCCAHQCVSVTRQGPAIPGVTEDTHPQLVAQSFRQALRHRPAWALGVDRFSLQHCAVWEQLTGSEVWGGTGSFYLGPNGTGPDSWDIWHWLRSSCFRRPMQGRSKRRVDRCRRLKLCDHGTPLPTDFLMLNISSMIVPKGLQKNKQGKPTSP